MIDALAIDAPSRRSHATFLDRAARRLVLGRLGRLQAGALRVQDAVGTRTCGAGPLVATLAVHDPRFYRMVASGGGLGAAEARIRGYWSADDLVAMLRLFVRDIDAADKVERGTARPAAWMGRLLHALRPNTRKGSRRNIHEHYDLGNAFFALFLDETMTYSSGVFERPDATLRDASVAKLDRLCRGSDLRAGHHLLEIGTGWGSLAIHAAREYGCRVTTTTISREQHALATERVRAAGLEDRVEVLLCDYRDLEGTYDRIISIEMIEAVGHRFLPAYFRTCMERLAPDGRMALQAITMPNDRYAQYLRSTDFIRRYVFPGSCVPSREAMLDAMSRSSDLRVESIESITPHYARTLAEWRRRFHARREDLAALGLRDEFVRLWDYYLCYCEAGFAERYIGCVQMVLTRPGASAATIASEVPVG